MRRNLIFTAIAVSIVLLSGCGRISGDKADMAQIPAGSFMMGCAPGDEDCDGDEKPRHEVTLNAFHMDKYEVTQEEFQRVMGSKPIGSIDCPRCPVEQVTWLQASFYCDKVGKRLPTEAEWEYAARAGTTTIYCCGDDPSCLDGIAWYDGDSGGQVHPVGEKTPNAWELYDMLGNVWEWVDDLYDATYYSTGPSRNPPNPPFGENRVLRGGAYDSDPIRLRASIRIGVGPGIWDVRDGLGFRCARD